MADSEEELEEALEALARLGEPKYEPKPTVLLKVWRDGDGDLHIEPASNRVIMWDDLPSRGPMSSKDRERIKEWWLSSRSRV